MDKPSDSTLTFIKIAKVLTILVYAYVIIAAVFLILGFILLLFGANQAAGFVHFVYDIAAQFLKPFREIFPGQPIGDRGYFSAAGLFAIIMYGIAAAALHSLLTFITLKQTKHVAELRALQARAAAPPSSRSSTASRYPAPPRSPSSPSQLPRR